MTAEAKANAGGGASGHGLGEEVLFGNLGQLFFIQVDIIPVRDDEHIVKRHKGQKPFDGLPEHGFPVARQGQQLFWALHPAPGPEALAPASGHDDCGDFQNGPSHFILF
jgi:hypothetical protein